MKLGEAMRRSLIAVIVVLLVSIVGYLAMDRHEKNVAAEKDKAFDQKYFK